MYSVRSTTCMVMTLIEYPSGVSDFGDIAELRGSAWLSQIPQSSLSPSLQSFPVSGLIVKTSTEEAIAGCYSGGKFAHFSPNLSPLGTSDFGIERHRDSIFRLRERALGNKRHNLCEYFKGFAFPRLLP